LARNPSYHSKRNKAHQDEASTLADTFKNTFALKTTDKKIAIDVNDKIAIVRQTFVAQEKSLDYSLLGIFLQGNEE